MHRLEDLHERLIGGRDAVAVRRFRRGRHIMAQSFPKPQDSMPAQRCADEHLNDRAARLVLVQGLEDLIGGRDDVIENLYEQCVVVIGEHFGQSRQRFLLALAHIVRQGNGLGIVTAIAIGALADDIDIAGHRIVFADRHLAQNERIFGMSLQRRHRVAHLAGQRVDLVDEDEMRQSEIFDRLEQDRQVRQPLR